MLALYAELDEKADTLRRADEMKSRFLSNMSHEFRTPLNSMMALSRLLLEDAERPLTAEQRRQVGYIRQAAEDLTELVNDLLDLAKVEAGKIVIRPAEFDVRDLFAALRGMLRPLLLNESVNLVFEEPDGLPVLHTDEGKVSQILRNLLSNALKFTERGEIRVSARIGRRRHGRVLGGRHRHRHRGRGPAAHLRGVRPDREPDPAPREGNRARPAAGPPAGHAARRRHRAGEHGGGRIHVHRQDPGALRGRGRPAPSGPSNRSTIEAGRVPVLVVEDSAQDLLLYEHYFRGSPFQAVAARTLPDARRLIDHLHPVAMVLDIRLQGEDAWAFISEVRRRDDTRAMPIVVVSSIDDHAKGLTLGASAYAIKPVHPAWLLGTLNRLLDREPGGRRVLVIDDDEISRYLVRNHLAGTAFDVREAAGPVEGLRDARAERPDAIVLDLVMPEMSGFDVLERLKEDPATMDIPVVVLTSKTLSDEDRRRLAPHALRILSKQALATGDSADDLRAALSAPTAGEAAP